MKKIMFNDRYDLTKAVLEGRKTMTRRIIKPQPIKFLCVEKSPDRSVEIIQEDDLALRIKSHYKVGEIVAVAQRYQDIFDYSNCVNPYALEDDDKPSGWTNKMFTKAELMPHQIRITSIRAERLQDITEEDCLREGIWKAENICIDGITYWYPNLTSSTFRTPREAFASLIDKISGRGTWQSNPYVWVYEFELLN